MTTSTQFFPTPYGARQHIREVLVGREHPEDAQDLYDLDAIERCTLIGPVERTFSAARYGLPDDETIRYIAANHRIPAVPAFSTLDRLKAELEPNVRDIVLDEGTLITFDLKWHNGKTYTYAALYRVGYWFTTSVSPNSAYPVQPRMTHERLMEVLRGYMVSNVNLATGFEKVA